MRLTSEQQDAIREEVGRIFGDDAEVRLFGSRVDDRMRGGDIDLHVEASGTQQELLDRELQLRARLLRRFGDRRIDIVVHERGRELRSIDRRARDTGVRL